MAQGDALILLPRLQLADSKLGGDEVGAHQCFAAIQGFVQGHGDACLADHPLAEIEDDVQFLFASGNIHQPQLADGQLGIALDETIDQLGGVAAAAANGDYLDLLAHKSLFIDLYRFDGGRSVVRVRGAAAACGRG